MSSFFDGTFLDNSNELLYYEYLTTPAFAAEGSDAHRSAFVAIIINNNKYASFNNCVVKLNK